jgi:hypothetical protein
LCEARVLRASQLFTALGAAVASTDWCRHFRLAKRHQVVAAVVGARVNSRVLD